MIYLQIGILLLFLRSYGLGNIVYNDEKTRYTVDAPVICTPTVGCMQGTIMEGQYKNFHAFMGIPFAQPPVGPLRFKDPQTFPKWNGTMQFTVPQNDCIQKNYLVPARNVLGEEDCLYLNIYKPLNLPFGVNKFPVIVYIYGGGWFSGTSNPLITGPTYFMNTGEVIFVTFNYRLGPFGFLSTHDEHMPGNFGLKDQRMVLKWIQNNIEYFDGDPNIVTLMGQSVGAVSAHMHMLSKSSEGLFHAVASLSGTANVPFAINDQPLQQVIDVACLCNISYHENMTTKELTQELRHVKARDLLDAGDGLKFWDVDNIVNFSPVVEKGADLSGAFFTKHPEQILHEGSYKAVPFMVGGVPNEGAVRVVPILESEQLTESFNSNFTEILQKLLEFPSQFSEDKAKEKLNLILMEHFNNITELNSITAAGFMDLITERGFHHPFYHTVKHYVNTKVSPESPLYLYRFNYKGPYTYATVYKGDTSLSYYYGVVHCDDLIYLLHSPLLFPDFERHSIDAEMVQLYVGNFIHFAKTKKPLFDWANGACAKQTFYNESNIFCSYQHFQNSIVKDQLRYTVEPDNRFNISRMKFWDNILEI